jgi:hypothetical protein
MKTTKIEEHNFLISYYLFDILNFFKFIIKHKYHGKKSSLCK